MLKGGGGLRDEDENEAGVCGAREWEVGDVGKDEERWLISLGEEERIEEEADEEQNELWDMWWWWEVRYEASSAGFE
jgi:hypothetical protein